MSFNALDVRIVVVLVVDETDKEAEQDGDEEVRRRGQGYRQG